MHRRLPTLALAFSLVGIAIVCEGAPAASALSFGRCPESPGNFRCATLSVPLDRSGRVPGAVELRAEAKLAGSAQSPAAVLALAGGPGQAALPLGEFIAHALAPALRTRDLLVFDQRGTGESGPLSCSALSRVSAASAARALERCALEIGPARGSYTTQESVQDIEALRLAAGYGKLVLYGTSYGTKVALEYAARYPEHVDALVLDSVVPVDGPEPFATPTFQALGSALNEICERGACAGITRNPLADIASLIARLRRRALHGVAYDGRGRRSRASLSEQGLLEIIDAGDLNPTLRALLPAAVRSALRNDHEPLLRLHRLAEGLIPSLPRQPVESAQPVDEALFVATSCEETPFPWRREAAPQARMAEALAALRTLPAADFYPFDASTALQSSLVPYCAFWPDASAAPAPPPPLPAVPTLILAGEQDLRTPAAGAERVQAVIPGAQLLLVPYTGHSVLGSDFSGCAETAVDAFFSGRAVQPCSSAQNLFAPTPISPTRLASLRLPHGLGGKPGRTLTAVLDAIRDLARQVIAATLQAEAELPSGSSFGGLRGGYARLTSSAVALHGFSFVTGVKVSGTFRVSGGRLQPARLRVFGSSASPGYVRFGSHDRVSGVLGGRRFNLSLARLQASRAGVAGGWPERPLTHPLAPLLDRLPAHLP
ncbi:MAG: alpha/beta fold hydrolase [Actinobacteria bacterium]|nr:MAG: alpha/beta fold hydrolase [Actinomycetota bacterium]